MRVYGHRLLFYNPWRDTALASANLTAIQLQVNHRGGGYGIPLSPFILTRENDGMQMETPIHLEN